MCTRAPLCTPVHPCAPLHGAGGAPWSCPSCTTPQWSSQPNFEKNPFTGTEIEVCIPPLLVNPSIVQCKIQSPIWLSINLYQVWDFWTFLDELAECVAEQGLLTFFVLTIVWFIHWIETVVVLLVGSIFIVWKYNLGGKIVSSTICIWKATITYAREHVVFLYNLYLIPLLCLFLIKYTQRWVYLKIGKSYSMSKE